MGEKPPDEDEEEGVYEEEIPEEFQIRMKNIGRMTKTSAGPNSYGKSQTGGFQDSKALLKARQKQCEELFYEQDKEAIDLKRQEKIDVRERFNMEQERRKREKEKQLRQQQQLASVSTTRTETQFQTVQQARKPSRFDQAAPRRDLDN